LIWNKINPVVNIPATFDARQQWPSCTTIGNIRDQGSCGSCWAFAATESLADRFCIASSGAVNMNFAPQYLVDCDSNLYGCGGGYLDVAWDDLLTIGTVSETCDPYQGQNAACPTACSNGKPLTLYKPKNAYSEFVAWNYPSTAALMQAEIVAHGPIEVAFWVFSDFYYYSKGVYQLSPGSTFIGGHAVKIIGWGVDNGLDYWLVANSWGADWGESGFFKIKRGVDECAIEDSVSTGIPAWS